MLCCATSSSAKASGSSSAATTALWPSSSTTIIAVSWSSGWLMVTIWPIFISALMTSEALIDILCATSATVMVSGTCTSMMRVSAGAACRCSSRLSGLSPRPPRGPPRQLLRPTPPLLSPRVLISFFFAGSPAQLEDSLADLTSLPAPGAPAAAPARAAPAAVRGAPTAGLGSVPFFASPAGAAGVGGGLGCGGGFGARLQLGRVARSGLGRLLAGRHLLDGRGRRFLFGLLGGVGGGALFGFALALFPRLACGTLGGQFGLLAANQFGLVACLLLTPGQFLVLAGQGRRGAVRCRRSIGLRLFGGRLWRVVLRGRRRMLRLGECGRTRAVGRALLGIVALDEGALFAHLHLYRARLAGGVGLLDLAGGLFDQRDLFAVDGGRAMAGLQVGEQPLLVRFGQRIGEGGLAHARCLELIEQGCRRFFEFGGELGDGIAGHIGFGLPGLYACPANQCSRAFMIKALASSSDCPVRSVSSSMARSARSSRVCTPPLANWAISAGDRPPRSRRSWETSSTLSSRAISIVSSASLARARSSLTVSSSKLSISSISCNGT